MKCAGSCACAVLCCAVLCCAVMWCDVMWCDVVWCDVLCCAVMCCAVLWCDVTWCDVMWCAVLCCAVLWCAVTWRDVMWCDVLWCDVTWRDVTWCDVMWCDVMWCDDLALKLNMNFSFNPPYLYTDAGFPLKSTGTKWQLLRSLRFQITTVSLSSLHFPLQWDFPSHPLILRWIPHSWVAFRLCFKAIPSAKPFIWGERKPHIYNVRNAFRTNIDRPMKSVLLNSCSLSSKIYHIAFMTLQSTFSCRALK